MESFDQGRAPLPDRVDATGVSELLAHWDELPEEGLANLARHPVHGPRLRHLQAAERWLEGLRLGEAATGPIPGPIPGPCPRAEELYDFARGPGYGPLPPGRRGSIADHLGACPACEALVDSLESAPPLPLDISSGGPEGAEPTPDPQPVAHPVAHRAAGPLGPLLRRRRGTPWIPLAAAAAVLMVSFFAFRDPPRVDGRLPAYLLLRGEAGTPLLFPRDAVLPPGAYPGGFAATPRFEVSPVEGARAYRIVVHRHDGGAFARGEVIAEVEADSPSLIADRPLEPGHYTWEAWAVVDGLDRALGERDFRVREDPTLAASLEGRPPRVQVWRLHEAGFLTDARHVARGLPASPERDAYLGAAPGR